jgi:hypothetical protein
MAVEIEGEGGSDGARIGATSIYTGLRVADPQRGA